MHRRRRRRGSRRVAIYLNPYTHFLIAVHYWGASAMIALVFLHLLQVLIWGAYKSPRELQWVVGVLLLLVTLVLGLTGYLLPWDMDAYFASQVSLNITGLAPGLGPVIQHIAQGGGSMGTETINRFFGLHVWLMPAVLVLLVGAHLTIFRHNGPAGPGRGRSANAAPGTLLARSVLHGRRVLAHRLHHHLLPRVRISAVSRREGGSDRSSSSRIRPGISCRSSGCSRSCRRRFIVGPLTIGTELIATIVVPTLFLIVVLLLPWLDRSRSRSMAARSGILWTTAIVVCGIVGLSIFAQVTTMAKQAAAPPRRRKRKCSAQAAAATLSRWSYRECRRDVEPRPTNANGRRSSLRTAPAVTARRARACPAPSRRLPTIRS